MHGCACMQVHMCVCAHTHTHTQNILPKFMQLYYGSAGIQIKFHSSAPFIPITYLSSFQQHYYWVFPNGYTWNNMLHKNMHMISQD